MTDKTLSELLDELRGLLPGEEIALRFTGRVKWICECVNLTPMVPLGEADSAYMALGNSAEGAVAAVIDKVLSHPTLCKEARAERKARDRRVWGTR